MLGDIETLLPHNAFLSEKADFLLNTAQSQIMQLFSIVALVFLPPILVAASYGMNFRLMPELEWPWGYPIGLGLLLAAGISPYLNFKHKGWFYPGFPRQFSRGSKSLPLDGLPRYTRKPWPVRYCSVLFQPGMNRRNMNGVSSR